MDWRANAPERRSNMYQCARSLHEQGASSEFIRVLMHTTDGRHLARQKVHDIAEGNDISLEQLRHRSGQFLTALIDGDLKEAWFRADGQNTRIMTEVFDEWEIDLHFEEKGPRDYTVDTFFDESWK